MSGEKIELVAIKDFELKPSKGEGKNSVAMKKLVDDLLDSHVVFVSRGKESGKGELYQSMLGICWMNFQMCFLRGYHL